MRLKSSRSKLTKKSGSEKRAAVSRGNLGTDDDSVKVKLLNYLLNEKHETGKEKAAYFKSLGFTKENWEELAIFLKFDKDLASSCEKNEWGQKYIQVIQINFDNMSKTRKLIAIWIHLKENREDKVKLVTLYPE